MKNSKVISHRAVYVNDVAALRLVEVKNESNSMWTVKDTSLFHRQADYNNMKDAVLVYLYLFDKIAAISGSDKTEVIASELEILPSPFN